ncbi:alpha/beta hydrolase [Pseudonocardia broussonetiae]|uniref:Esterase n=1 Tax=Pseudonocardia broussonetiae TaxID=2736640 RepID=A0A6M6JNA7_9PSEU|nr:alpha/beta hydrolase-fold protein [Pseudonocardia broussonetiae]QJY48786.1 esterase [Pseudonocardia broussonetiae]
MLDWSLLGGPLPWALLGAGGAALVALLLPRGGRWWGRAVPAVLVGAAVLTGAAVLVVDVLWRPFPDPLPLLVVLAVGVGLVAVGLAVARLRWWTPVAAALVVLAAAQGVNGYYEEFPTVRTALGLAAADVLPFADVVARQKQYVGPAGAPLESGWRPPADMPDAGVVSRVDIPATVSGFPARPAWVYLPPAYLGSTRARLPVLVLLSGQPGSPDDWLTSGELARRADAYAAEHGGLAPVVVMPDHLGDPLANPLCVDSPLGNAFTYLTVDVPAWIRATLQVAPGGWAVGGLSNGGTCSLQLAVTAPDLFPTFVDVSGEDAPTLGDRAETIARAFGGDEAAYRAVNPLDVLAARPFPGTAGYLVAGLQDSVYLPQARRVFAAAQAAGMDVEFHPRPGEHTWEVWGPGLGDALPWLGTRLGLTS